MASGKGILIGLFAGLVLLAAPVAVAVADKAGVSLGHDTGLNFVDGDDSASAETAPTGWANVDTDADTANGGADVPVGADVTNGDESASAAANPSGAAAYDDEAESGSAHAEAPAEASATDGDSTANADSNTWVDVTVDG